jgi:hypothetical protein
MAAPHAAAPARHSYHLVSNTHSFVESASGRAFPVQTRWLIRLFVLIFVTDFKVEKAGK